MMGSWSEVIKQGSFSRMNVNATMSSVVSVNVTVTASPDI
jgi:hypothetical protein